MLAARFTSLSNTCDRLDVTPVDTTQLRRTQTGFAGQGSFSLIAGLDSSGRRVEILQERAKSRVVAQTPPQGLHSNCSHYKRGEILAQACMSKTRCQRLDSCEDFVSHRGTFIQDEWRKTCFLNMQGFGVASAYLFEYARQVRPKHRSPCGRTYRRRTVVVRDRNPAQFTD
jgi:hypothetical protein